MSLRMKNPVDEGSPASIELRIQEAGGESRVIADEVKSAMAATETVAPPKTLPSKVLFLDGVRGLAAMLVVTQHSHEYLQSLNLGAVAVDAFFVLSSFLMTWLFLKKSIKLMEQVPAMVVSLFPFHDQHRYFLVRKPSDFNLLKVLTFEFDHRFFVLWTLPMEISYYFIIPVFVVVVLKMRRFWWIWVAALSVWVVHEGCYEYRTSHSRFPPHIPTFISGSLAAVIFVKLDLLIKKTDFKIRTWHNVVLRISEGLIIALLLSVCFEGLFFDWVHSNPVPDTSDFPYVSGYITMLFVIEMVHPSCVSAIFEWNVLRYWGKISFSVYLLHSFVVWNPTINAQPKYFNRLFSRLFLLLLLATISYHLVEYPSQLLAQRISKALAQREKATRDEPINILCLKKKLCRWSP